MALLWLWIIAAPGIVLLADSRDARRYLVGLTGSWREPGTANRIERPAIDARVNDARTASPRPVLPLKEDERATLPREDI